MHARSPLLIALLTMLAACGDKQGAPARDSVMMPEAAAPAAAPPPPPAKVDFGKPAGGLPKKASDAQVGDSLTTASTTAQLTSSSATYVDGERKFIRTASASFLAKDVYQSSLAIEDAAASLGGFVTRNEIGAEVQQTQRHPGRDGMV